MLVKQKIIKVISVLTAVDEDNGTDGMHLLKESYHKLSLVIRLGLEDDLSNVGSGASGKLLLPMRLGLAWGDNLPNVGTGATSIADTELGLGNAAG